MRWLVSVAGLTGMFGLIGATLYAHVRPVPALQQAAYIALFHAPVFLWLSREKRGFLPALLAAGFLIGTALFTGSIYLRYLAGVDSATTIAPAGGTLLILSWLGLAFQGFRGK